MFFLPRYIFAVLLFLTAGIFIYFHFHGPVTNITFGIAREVKEANYKLNASENIYNVMIKDIKPAPKVVPSLPDITGFTVDNIAAKAPEYKPGKAYVTDMSGLPGVREYTKKDGRLQRLRLAQLTVTPRVIYLEEGSYDLTSLYEEIKAQTPTALEKIGNKYLLRLPILVGEKGALTISDKDTTELLLAQDRSVFIANSGDLFILRTKVTGWNEKEGKPSYFRGKTIYRPFLVSWSGARMYIAGSTISHLGYPKGKSYGITYSTCAPCLEAFPNLPRPTGAIVGSTFVDIYFGFYSYEADDIAIVNNVYANSIIYGIDPHDRSRRLIIARNKVYGTRKKHGIIASRDVDDSWIFDNYSFYNKGSGIMLDRSCSNNIVANNISAYNHGDGLTFFESDNNAVYDNKIYQNKSSGIRIRNSSSIRLYRDQIADNAGIPIVIYSTDLIHAPHDTRDLVKDPYSTKVEVSINKSIIKQLKRKPAIKIDRVESISLSDLRLLSESSIFSDPFLLTEEALHENIDTPYKQIIVTKKSVVADNQQKVPTEEPKKTSDVF